MYCDLTRFNFNLFLQNQTYTIFKIFVASQYKASIVCLDISIAVSSAKLINSVLLFILISRRSLINIINNNGPNTVPCGTPQDILRSLL